MIVTVSLTQEIVLRMWSGGPDKLTIISTIITVILTSSPLTSHGRDLAKWLLAHLRIRDNKRSVAILAISCIAFILVLGIRISLPILGRFYNQQGYKHYLAGNLTAAQHSFTRAVSLNPDYAAGLYNLADGLVDIGDYEKAHSIYQNVLGADRNLDLAYNGMGYTLIMQGRNKDAILILYSGLAVAQDDESRLALLANLGRAYLADHRAFEAEEVLDQALDIDPTDASTNCSLAAVYEFLSKPDEQQKVAWEKCLAYATDATSRHQEMAATARAHLRLLAEK